MVQFINLIHLPTFLFTFIIGILFIYIYKPNRKTIHVFPTPDNMDKILIKDNSDTCFAFKAKPIECPLNKSQIKGYTIQ